MSAAPPAWARRRAIELVEALTPAGTRTCPRTAWASGNTRQRWRYACGYVGLSGEKHDEHHRRAFVARALVEARGQGAGARDTFEAGYRAGYDAGHIAGLDDAREPGFTGIDRADLAEAFRDWKKGQD